VALNLARQGRQSVATLRERLREDRRRRKSAVLAARHMTPPAPGSFGAFGVGSVVGPLSRVTSPECIFIGDRVVIHELAWISVVSAVPGVTPRLTIADDTLIDRMLHIACVGEIEIGPEVLIGERVLISDTYHEYEDVTRPVIEQPMAPPRSVKIGRSAGIGLAACIMPGVTIGENAYVAAGTLVNGNVPPRTVAAGNPGRVVRRWNDDEQHW
jgi:acetyltransferase-like isoleucine patch superfamily enzyme